jgi:hypothetical protein
VGHTVSGTGRLPPLGDATGTRFTHPGSDEMRSASGGFGGRHNDPRPGLEDAHAGSFKHVAFVGLDAIVMKASARPIGEVQVGNGNDQAPR